MAKFEFMKTCAAVDTMVWILAAEQHDPDATALVSLRDSGAIELFVSHHSLAQLEASTPAHGRAAFDLAASAVSLPCYPTGTIAELAGPISGLAGTLGEIGATDDLRCRLAEIATSGTDIRDRGALIDTYRAGIDWFITLDNGIVGDGPRRRILEAMRLHAVRPVEFLAHVRTNHLVALP